VGERTATRRDGLNTEIDVRGFAARLARGLVRHRVGVTLAVGVLLRVALYLADRPLWLDEMSLSGNIEGRTAAGLFAPYTSTQLAPAGFLVVEWVVSRALGTGPMALRLFPLVCGVGALFGFAALARRALRPWAAWVAVALFAVSGDLAYYSSELKPYATDVAAAVACTLAGLVVGAGPGPVSARRFVGFALLGATAVWLSFPSALVLAGVGTTMIASALARGEWRRASALALAAAAWGASFAGSNALAVRMLGPDGRRAMNVFWGFAFPPWPPASWSWRDAAWPARRVLHLFLNPLDFHAPLGPVYSPWIAVACCAVGAVSLWRRDRRLLGVLAAPLAFALGAAYLRLYPFHGRLALYLAPALLLIIAEGADRVAGTFRARAWRAAVLAALLLVPSARAADSLLEPSSTAFHNGYGDLGREKINPYRHPL
jgi:hypothetical protein